MYLSLLSRLKAWSYTHSLSLFSLSLSDYQLRLFHFILPLIPFSLSSFLLSALNILCISIRSVTKVALYHPMKKKQKKMIYHRHRNPFIRKPTKKIVTKRRKTTTTQPINSEERQRPRFVTFTVTDSDATDSSSSDEDERENVAAIRKRKAMGRSNHRAASAVNPGGKSKFRGVRRRLSGNWAAEIRNSKLQTRVWLGTYETAEEAAMAYDIEAIRIRGPNARTNLLKPPPSNSRDPSPSPSPKSVLMLSPIIDDTCQFENNMSEHPNSDDEKVRDSARSGQHRQEHKSGTNEEEGLSRELEKPFDLNFLSKYIGELTPPPPPLIYFYGNNMVKEELGACW